MKTGIIILAAGGSTRLCEPKQQLLFNGKTLLQWALKAAEESACEPVIVVLGAHNNVIAADVDSSTATAVYNDEWEQGMATSITKGITALTSAEPTIDGVVIMLCDQPFADAQLINALVQQKLATGKKIVASAYNHTLGVPAFFDRAVFAELLNLKGQEGAKKLVLKNVDEVAAVPFPKGTVDIDTMEDYKAAIASITGE